jgi:hypothetical protein
MRASRDFQPLGARDGLALETRGSDRKIDAHVRRSMSQGKNKGSFDDFFDAIEKRPERRLIKDSR